MDSLANKKKDEENHNKIKINKVNIKAINIYKQPVFNPFEPQYTYISSVHIETTGK